MTGQVPLFNMKSGGVHQIGFACFLLGLLVLMPELASSTVHARCPYNPNANLLSTSGCHSETDHQSALTHLVRLNIGTFPKQHVEGVFDSFLGGIRTLKEDVHTKHREWRYASLNIPRGIYDLNPMPINTTTLTNTHATNRHRILRELRWWMTAVESGLQLVQSTGQLGVRSGNHLACEASIVSNRLKRLLRIFSVDTHSLPHEAGCRQIVPITTDSSTERISVTSIILRDTMNAMNRMDQVLSSCEVRNHSEGRHRVRLHCPPHFSLFYDQPRYETDAYLYHFDHIVDSLRQDQFSFLP